MCFGNKSSSSTAKAAAPAVAVATKSRSSSARVKSTSEPTAADTLLPPGDGAAPAAPTGNQDATTIGGVSGTFGVKKRKSGLGL